MAKLGWNEKKILEMITNKEFLEFPICPFCGELTDLRGEYLPCCGEETEKIEAILKEGKKIKWVRLVPIQIVEST